MELLEGAFYGMDLLKLHSVTTKLINRIENIEKVSSYILSTFFMSNLTGFYFKLLRTILWVYIILILF